MTVVFNVPRNDRLSTVDAQNDDGVQYRQRYLSEWTGGNYIRTACAMLAAGLLAT